MQELLSPGWPLLVVAVVLATIVAAALALADRFHRHAQRERLMRLRAERQARLADSLQQVAAAVSRAKTAASVIDVAIPEFLHAFNAAAGALLIVHDDLQSAHIVRTVGCGEPTEQAPPFALTEYPAIVDAVRRHEVTMIESGPPKGPGALSVPALEFIASHESAVVVPFITGGRAVGVLAMSFRDARQLAADELDLLLKAGRRTAEALVRANAYDAAERARASAEDYRLRADAEISERQKAEAALRESEIKYRALAARTEPPVLAQRRAVGIEHRGRRRRRNGPPRQDRGWRFRRVGRAADSRRRGIRDAARRSVRGTAGRSGRPVPGRAGTRGDHGRANARAGLRQQLRRLPRALLAVGSARGRWRLRFRRNPAAHRRGRRGGSAGVSFHGARQVRRGVRGASRFRGTALRAGDRSGQIYERAQRAKTDAESENRSKDDFLSTVSHELRTPLTAVLGWAGLLRSGALDPARTRRAIDAIYNNATRQAQLIDELLDISRIVSGRAALDLEELDLGQSLRGAVEAVMPLADSNGLELRLGPLPTVPVRADARRLEQVFLNLLSNAVKFTPSGGHVTVAVAAAAQSVEVRVADDGGGIDPAFLPHVFERFRQGENSTSRSVSGLGLGLFITRQLVEAQGGTVRAESRGRNQGSIFIVSLPIAPGARPRDHSPQDSFRAAARAGGDEILPITLAGIRVLLADDEADIRELMTAALEKAGATVISVDSAAAALHVLGDRDIDVLLADIAMPGQDGYDLIRAVRMLPEPRTANIRAAAVTACARDDERQRALAAGFQLHLAKPLQPAALVQAVAQLVDKSAVSAP